MKTPIEKECERLLALITAEYLPREFNQNYFSNQFPDLYERRKKMAWWCDEIGIEWRQA